jgi:hypothetical protein
MKTKTISLPEELLDKGLERAQQDNRNFSSYVQSLIQKDLDKAKQPPAPEHSVEPSPEVAA